MLSRLRTLGSSKGRSAKDIDVDGINALFVAVRSGNCRKCIELLQSRNVNPNSYDEAGVTLLYTAAAFGYADIVAALCEANADSEAPNGEDGLTALHAAAAAGHVGAAEVLIVNGADANSTSRHRSNPLHLAAERGHAEMCSRLLDWGASANLKDKDGQRPLDVALVHGHLECARVVARELKGTLGAKTLWKGGPSAAASDTSSDADDSVYGCDAVSREDRMPLWSATVRGPLHPSCRPSTDPAAAADFTSKLSKHQQAAASAAAVAAAVARARMGAGRAAACGQAPPSFGTVLMRVSSLKKAWASMKLAAVPPGSEGAGEGYSSDSERPQLMNSSGSSNSTASGSSRLSPAAPATPLATQQPLPSKTRSERTLFSATTRMANPMRPAPDNEWSSQGLWNSSDVMECNVTGQLREGLTFGDNDRYIIQQLREMDGARVAIVTHQWEGYNCFAKFYIEHSLFDTERQFYLFWPSLGLDVVKRARNCWPVIKELYPDGAIPGVTAACLMLECGDYSLRDLLDKLQRQREEEDPEAEASECEALRALGHMCESMSMMHEYGWVHRDIKDSNLVYFKDADRWKLVDFAITQQAGFPAAPQYTLQFAPPEVLKAQMAGQPDMIATPAMDVWSVGMVLLKLFTPRHVFKAFAQRELLQMLVGVRPFPWEAQEEWFSTHLPPLAAQVLSNVLIREPAKRMNIAGLRSSGLFGIPS